MELNTAANINDFSNCGIVPSVLSRPIPCTPATATGTGQHADSISGGYLYYPPTSFKANTGVNRRKPNKNRKAITYSSFINHANTNYEINNGASGIYSRILHRLITELDAAINLWGRVFALRFDLHHKGITTFDNKWLSRFFKNLKRRLERGYGMQKIGYGWVREHERGKAQHYHVILYLDGDKIRHSSKINETISDTWKAVNPANFAYHPRNPFYFIGSQEVKNQLVYRVSYMAKVRGKGYRDKQVKDFYCSSLRGK